MEKIETCLETIFVGRDNLESNIQLQLRMPLFNIWLGPDLTDEVMSDVRIISMYLRVED